MDRVVKTTPLRQDSKIISALKPLSFISVDGKHFKASEFYDPRITFFKQMLGPEKFPRDKYTTTEWLELLGSLGLITEVNADMILMCARSIDRSNDKNVMKAEYFVQYLWSHFSDFWSLSLCEQLSKLKFVPVRRVRAGENFNHVTHFNTNNSNMITKTQVRSAKSYLDDESESQMQLCTYSECTIPGGDIVFLVRPILRDVHVPPAIAWEHLRLKSPPPLRDVLKHVDLVTKSRWTWHHSLVETFQSVFAFLQKHWSDFSNKQQRHLRTLRLIPINGRLVRASQLFQSESTSLTTSV